MIVLKLGGSVITDKKVPYSIREDVLKRLAHEIRDSRKKVVVVHGGGSFGHPLASRYSLQDGLKDPEQIIGVVKTKLAMNKLNNKVIEIFISQGVSAVSIQTSAVFVCKNRRIKTANLSVIEDFLRLGFMPVLYGDVVVDEALGVCILSGDQIVSYLARRLLPERVIFAADVDGVLDEKGRLIESVNSKNIPSLSGSLSINEGDVTGGMRGKVEELIKLADDGISSLIINAQVEGRVKNALLGKKTKGTLFEVEND